MISLKWKSFNIAIEEKEGMSDADLIFIITCDKLPNYEHREFSKKDIHSFEETLNLIRKRIAMESLTIDH